MIVKRLNCENKRTEKDIKQLLAIIEGKFRNYKIKKMRIDYPIQSETGLFIRNVLKYTMKGYTV